MSNTGMFDADEWKFECKRDDRAEKEAEIRKSWNKWAARNFVYTSDEEYNKSHNRDIREYADKNIGNDIKALK